MSRNLVTLNKINTGPTEFFKMLRSNIQLELDKDEKIMMFTSAEAADGKSYVVSNLGATFAATDKRVLIIDLDLRKGTQRKIFEMKKQPGVEELLSDSDDLDDKEFEKKIVSRISKTYIDNLFLLPVGDYTDVPSEMFLKPILKTMLNILRKYFDYILIDTPPINIVTDATIVAKHVDVAMLVTSVNKTQIKGIKDAKKAIDRTKVKFIGAICNKAPIYKKSYNGYGYSYDYQYTSTDNQKRRRRKS